MKNKNKKNNKNNNVLYETETGQLFVAPATAGYVNTGIRAVPPATCHA